MDARTPRTPFPRPQFRARPTLIGVALAMSALLGLVAGAAAHPETYPNLSNFYPGAPGPTPYYVRFDAGHVPPDVDGFATLTIIDTLTPIGGLVCQDLNEDQVCGDENEFELAVVFCGSITIQDENHGGPWDPKFDLYVFQASLFTPSLACGPLGYHATLGNVFHT